MSAAAVEHPYDGPPERMLEAADRLTERLPGYRVEIIGGVITVAPPPDGAHARALRKLMRPFRRPGWTKGRPEVLQAIGLWLPGGPEDYAIPDLAVVDADFDEHLIGNNCYDPAVFRLVLEVTSSNYKSDLRNKVATYAEAKIPVYVILDRRHGRIHVLTEPTGCTYDSHEVYAPGQSAALPASIGAEMALDVGRAGQGGPSPRRGRVSARCYVPRHDEDRAVHRRREGDPARQPGPAPRGGAVEARGPGRRAAAPADDPLGDEPAGLVKHLATVEYGWFCDTFGRPTEDLPFDETTRRPTCGTPGRDHRASWRSTRGPAPPPTGVAATGHQDTGTSWHGRPSRCAGC